MFLDVTNRSMSVRASSSDPKTVFLSLSGEFIGDNAEFGRRTDVDVPANIPNGNLGH